MKYLIILLLSLFPEDLFKGKVETKEPFFLFEISYSNKFVPEYSPRSYALIHRDSLMHFKVYEGNVPSLLLNISENGGYYLVLDRMDYELLGCCKFENPEKGLNNYFDGNLSPEELKSYRPHGLTDNLLTLMKPKAANFQYYSKKNKHNYKVKVWEVDADFCVCQRYMSNPEMEYLRNVEANLLKIITVDKPKDRKIISRFIREVVNLDMEKTLIPKE